MGSTVIGFDSGVLRRVTASIEKYGTKCVLYKAIDSLLQKALKTSVQTVVWLDVKSLAEMPAPDPRFTFRFLTADEVARHAADPVYYLDASMADRVRSGRDLCFAALAGDRLAAFGWYALESIEPEHAGGVAMSYPPDVAYMYFGFTHPDFRGARLHGLIMGLALNKLAGQGVSKLVSFVAWTNWSSLKSCYRLGYISLGNMIAVGSSHRAAGIYPAAAKKLGVRFGRRAARRGYSPAC